MNVGIHLNPDCEIKLRMDNADDGYISTYGSGTLQAYYHNKGSFTLDGPYNIQSGKYRLYLQDLIYRDLDIQDGSSVVFNGNPFDAGIHLICWHTLNAVPLNDLTSNTGYSSNNKVKVICILDITGNLSNMTFNFDLNLPNVSDETRQLVRSLISTDEEMTITTDAGALDIDGSFDNEKNLMAHMKSESLNLKQILNDEKFGQTAFNLHVDGSLAAKQPSGTVNGTIEHLDYSDYTYQNIALNGLASADGFEGHASIDDPNVRLAFDGKINNIQSVAETDMKLSLQDFNPHALHLTNEYAGETFNLRARVNTKGNSFDTAVGTVNMDGCENASHT